MKFRLQTFPIPTPAWGLHLERRLERAGSTFPAAAKEPALIAGYKIRRVSYGFHREESVEWLDILP